MLASVLKLLPPEFAHRVAIRAAAHFSIGPGQIEDKRLAVEAFGLSFPNPLGLAAGFDKSAEAVDGLARLGFGFVEVGTLTPMPQIGNPKPRLFRLRRDHAIVNRMGFNNDGFMQAHGRLRRARRRGIVGVNIGPNKDSLDRLSDYVSGLRTFADVADYFAINISSPNTPGLRNFHNQTELKPLLASLIEARDGIAPRRPLLLKIAPDIDDVTLDGVLSLSMQSFFDGLIVSNTTTFRQQSLSSASSSEVGGLSGRPLFSKSTRLVAKCFLRCGGDLPIVGVGGIDDTGTAFAKIEAGARLIQIYTGLTYRGPRLVGEIVAGLGERLDCLGLKSLETLIGSRAKEIAGEV